MNQAVVLDAAAFDTIDGAEGRVLRQLLRRASERGDHTVCAAVTLAEVCRGLARTRRVEAALARTRGGRRILVVPTDERLAKLVGAILHESGRGSEHLADAHVVAVSANFDTAVVITSDPEDITALAAAIPGSRVVARRP
ncbi:MAG: PIN domain-containing protein [Sporichthyaceae bacterium]